MKMRKYSMGGQRVAQLKRLLRNDKVQVARVAVAAHEKRGDTVYVFFNLAVEEDAKERKTLKLLKAKAGEITKDEVYPKLKNAKQRELYLFDHYKLSKRECVDVVELLKIAEVEADIGGGKTERAKEESEKEKDGREVIQDTE